MYPGVTDMALDIQGMSVSTGGVLMSMPLCKGTMSAPWQQSDQ